jgi:hypothetical protein
MVGSRHEDYLLRQVRAIAAMLARMAGLRASGRDDEARLELEDAYGLLLESRAELIRRVDARTAATLLGSAEKVFALAELSREEAALEEDDARSAFLRERACELAIEAALCDPENEPVCRFLKELLPQVDRQRLADRYRAALAPGGALASLSDEAPQA